MIRTFAAVLVSVSLLGACSGGNDSTAPGSTSRPTPTPESPPVMSASVESTLAPTTSAAAFDPSDAKWVIQEDAIVMVVGANGVGEFSPTGDISGFDENNPDWSPDGAQLTFTVVDGHDDLWVVGVDGVGARKLDDCNAPCDYLDDPAWSPTGGSIAVCKMTESGEDHLGTLITVDVQTGAETVLAGFAPEDFCSGPRWSPDGSEISFELVHRAGTGLFDKIVGVALATADLRTAPPVVRTLTDPALFASWGSWKPSGDLIVYSALATPDANMPDLYSMRPDGSDRRQLTNLAVAGRSATQGTFDLDGTGVVFADETQSSLLRVDLASGAITKLFTTNLFGDHPRPRPTE
jgi:Tol biopolymer transport system component